MKKNPLKVLPNPISKKFPKWLHRALPKGGSFFRTSAILQKYQINTVCEEAKCPNRFSCYTKKTATFLALGKACTRSCAFCDIDFAKNPLPIEENEPYRIAQSVKELGLRHVVITMVARDDLENGGANGIVAIVQEIRKTTPQVTIELLTSDFSGNEQALLHVLSTKPEIFNHNLETVESLSRRIRHKATYQRSLDVLKQAKNSRFARFIKSGLMVGLGEKKEEVFDALHDLRRKGVDLVTIGQYLQASKRKIRVKEFVTPSTFTEYENYAKNLGFLHVYAGAFVRSSLNAQQVHDLLTKAPVT